MRESGRRAVPVISDLTDPAAHVTAVAGGTSLALCARNEFLRRRLEREPAVVPLGWHDDVPPPLLPDPAEPVLRVAETAATPGRRG